LSYLQLALRSLGGKLDFPEGNECKPSVTDEAPPGARRQGCEKSEVSEKSPVPAWDQAEADRLLSKLREAIARSRQGWNGRFPPALAAVAADSLAVARGYVERHEDEARRGWNALELLRGMMPLWRDAVANARRMASTAKEGGGDG
jgi:hypothetical protein